MDNGWFDHEIPDVDEIAEAELDHRWVANNDQANSNKTIYDVDLGVLQALPHE